MDKNIDHEKLDSEMRAAFKVYDKSKFNWLKYSNSNSENFKIKMEMVL